MKKNRIEEYYTFKGFDSAKAFAKRLGISDSHITEIDKRLKNNTLINAIRSVPEFNDLNIAWLETGTGGMIYKHRVIDRTQMFKVAEPPTDYISMPVRVLAGAGDPCDLEQLEPIDQIIIHKDLDGPHIQVVEIRGKSMEPSIVNGARVGVDTADKIIISGEIYACYIRHEGIVVKRIIMGPDTVTIKSDNPSFPDQEVLIDRIDWATFIQGRVKWILQKYI